MNIVTAAFGSDLFDPSRADGACTTDGSEAEELACEWQAIAKTANKAGQAETLDAQWVSMTSNVSLSCL